MKRWAESTCLVLVLLIVACAGEPETGPGEVRWDKVSCARCIMAVSDHHYSAQVRGGPSGRKTKLYYFDDLGCAVLWLDEQDWRGDQRTEMWVTAAESGVWLDAFKAILVRFETNEIHWKALNLLAFCVILLRQL